MMGININDKREPFTEWILAGTKTLETRNTPSLRPYLHHRVGIVRTGKGPAMLVGYATISREVWLGSWVFDRHYNEHRVSTTSTYHPSHSGKGCRGGKWCYELEDVVKLETPIRVTSRGIVARQVVEEER